MKALRLLSLVLIATLTPTHPLRAAAEPTDPATAEPDPRAKIEEVERQIDALQQQKEALERKAEEAEQRARLREELADRLRDGRERLQQIDDQLGELAGAEATDSAAVQAERQARAEFLKAQRPWSPISWFCKTSPICRRFTRPATAPRRWTGSGTS